VVAVAEALARAVHHVHQRGIVHRNLKPRVVLLKEDGTPKLTGFGLAKWLHPGEGKPDLDEEGSICGTPSYMAPEQVAGRNELIREATDIWGLGAVIYELLTGRPPFRGSTVMDTINQIRAHEAVPPRRFRSEIPRPLEAICLKCLQKEQSRRHASAEEVARELSRFRK
jgi:serine/threonine protein kinase